MKQKRAASTSLTVEQIDQAVFDLVSESVKTLLRLIPQARLIRIEAIEITDEDEEPRESHPEWAACKK
jgi:hypothetical protein